MNQLLKIGAFWLIALPSFAESVTGQQLANAAFERTKHFVIYDGSYKKIDYPMGDVSPRKGVCTDVLIRAYRTFGIDLQQLVHEDMKAVFSEYPKNWGLSRPDTNIDHRRVPNLEKFFSRKGIVLPVTQSAADYKPGDIVSWRLDNNLPHIGIVSNKRTRGSGRPLIIHNIGWGPKQEDALFDYKIVGHYRFLPEKLVNP